MIIMIMIITGTKLRVCFIGYHAQTFIVACLTGTLDIDNKHDSKKNGRNQLTSDVIG